MTRFFSIAVFLVFLFVPTIDAADDAGHRELLATHYRLVKPDGAGPFPAVMMVPGLRGFYADFAKRTYDAVQSRLVQLGFVILRVDYLGARNLTSTIASPVSPEQVAADICVAGEYLRQQPFVKKGAINVMGWSFGASSALQALGRAHSREPLRVDAVIGYYPHCDFVQQKWDSEVPVLVLAGAMDNVASLRKCNYPFSGMPSQKLVVKEYDDAHHCFDMLGLPAETQYQYETIGYNEAAAKSAWSEVTNFLRK